MTPERKAKLEAFEWWGWDPHDDAWNTKFAELVAYYAEHGRCPPQSTTGLGAWIANQRASRATMTPERKARLEALEWWVWDPYDDAWHTKFDEVVAFYEANGSFPLASMPGLGKWVHRQRQALTTMSAERKAKLEALEWWVWNLRATHVTVDWDARFDELAAYQAEHGRLPQRSTPGGLGTWVHNQRSKRATMSAERKARLDGLPWWSWSVRE